MVIVIKLNTVDISNKTFNIGPFIWNQISRDLHKAATYI